MIQEAAAMSEKIAAALLKRKIWPSVELCSQWQTCKDFGKNMEDAYHCILPECFDLVCPSRPANCPEINWWPPVQVLNRPNPDSFPSSGQARPGSCYYHLASEGTKKNCSISIYIIPHHGFCLLEFMNWRRFDATHPGICSPNHY